MTGLSRCLKFEANIFDKTKCQHCFKPKELHSAAALENNKASRKITRCGYLFVAPDSFDFNNPLDKTKRWQRRFLVLYDDGELTYSVDENVHTVPQGTIDMNRSTDVSDAESLTGHINSISIRTPSGITYIKGTSKEESASWLDILAKYPAANNKPKKHKRVPTFHGTIRPPETQVNGEAGLYVAVTSSNVKATRHSSPYIRSVSDTGLDGPAKAINTPAIQYRGIRALKNKDDKHLDALKKSKSFNNIESTDDDIDIDASVSASGAESADSAKPRTLYESLSNPEPKAPEPKNARYLKLAGLPQRHSIGDYVMGQKYSSLEVPSTPQRRLTDPLALSSGSADDSSALSVNPRDRIRRKLSGTTTKRSSSVPATARTHRLPSESESAPNSFNGHHKNETDERKMAKNHIDSTPVLSDDLSYIKKGWLVKRGSTDKEWTKHWFVLSGSTLACYADSASEDLQNAQQRIDLSASCNVAPVETTRNYGFRLQVGSDEYILSAMTSGIRQNWIHALDKCSQAAVLHAPRRSRRYLSMPGISNDVPSDSGDEKSYTSSRRSRYKDSERNPRDRHTMTCTWPYQSDSDVRSPRSPLRVQDQTQPPHVPNVADYLEEGEQPVKLTQEQQQELDHVEQNIRRIHRKSISEFVQNRMPQTEKFEDPLHASSSDRSGWSSPCEVTSPHGRRSDPRSPGYRAPSAKIKDRSRAKSPRARSPPPDLPQDRMLHPPDLISSSGSAKADNAWRQSSLQGDIFRFGSDIDLSSTDGDLPEFLSDALAAEPHLPLSALPPPPSQSNAARKVSASSLLSDHSSSSVHPLQARIQELETQVTKAEQKVKAQRQELANREDKLDSCLTEMSKMETTRKEMQHTIDKTRSQEKTLTRKIEALEKAVQQKELAINHLEEDLGLSDDKLAQVEADLEEKSEKLEETEERLRLNANLEAQLGEHKNKAAELLSALDHARHEVQQLKHELQHGSQQEGLMEQVAALQTRLEESQKKSCMADSLSSSMADILREKDETISQLEEKLIESDSRVDVVSEELQQEMQEHTKMQENFMDLQLRFDQLQKTSQPKESSTQVELLRKDLERVEESLSAIKTEKTEMEALVKSLEQQLSEAKNTATEKDQDYEGLLTSLSRTNSQREHYKKKFDKSVKETELLKEKVRQLEEELSCKKDATDEEKALKQVSGEMQQLRELNSQLQTQLSAHLEEGAKQVSCETALKEQLEKAEAELKTAQQQRNEVQSVKHQADLSFEKDAKISELQSKVGSMEHEMRNLQSASETQAERLEAKVMELAQELDATEKKNRRLERKLRSAEDEKPETGESTPDLEAKLADLQARITHLQSNEMELITMKEIKAQSRPSLPAHQLSTQVGDYQVMIDHCKSKLSELISSPSLDIKGNLKQLLSEMSEPEKQNDARHLRQFAEQLALESLIISQVSSSASKTSGQDDLLLRISLAQHKMHLLDERVGCISSASTSPMDRESLEAFSSLLADRLIKGSDFQLQLATLTPQATAPPPDILLADLGTSVHVKSAAELLASQDSSQLLCLPDQVELQSQLSSQLATFHSQLLKNPTDAHSELCRMHQELIMHETQSSDKVKSYLQEKSVELAKVLALRKSEVSDAQAWQKETLHKELLHAAKCRAQKYSAELFQVPSVDTEQVLGVIQESLTSDIVSIVNETMQLGQQLASEELPLDLGDLSMFKGPEIDPTQRAQYLERGRAKCIVLLADVLACKAVIKGHLCCIQHMLKSTEFSKTDTESFSSDAQVRAELASYLMNNGSSGEFNALKNAASAIAAANENLLQPLQVQSSPLFREALSQAQLTLTVRRLVLEQQKKEKEVVRSLSLKHEETVANLKEQLNRLQKIIDNSVLEQQGEGLSRAELEHKHRSHEQEVQSLKSGYEIRIKSLLQDLESVASNADKSAENDRQMHASELQGMQDELTASKAQVEFLRKEQDQTNSQWRHRINALEQEVRMWRERQKHSAEEVAAKEQELERARSVSSEQDLESALLSPNESFSGDPFALASKIQQLEMQIQNLQGDYEQELAVQRSAHRREIARTKEEVQQMLESGEGKGLQLDEESIRKKFLKEMEHMKEIYDKGFSSMERSHQRVLMQMRKAHKQELESLRQEKDQLLAEETHATQAALDAMRKAQEGELRKERDKFLAIIAKTYSQTELEALQTQHEEDMELLQWEMKQLMEQYSLRCLENAALHERLEQQTNILQQTRTRSASLFEKNEELVTRLKHEVQRLKRYVEQPALAADPEDSTEVASIKLALQLKHSEVHQLQSELDRSLLQLQEKTQDLEESHRQHSAAEEEHQTKQKHLEAEVKDLQHELSSIHDDDDKESVSSPSPQLLRKSARKVSSWRQKNPERAMSNPGIPVTKRLSLPTLPSIPSRSERDREGQPPKSLSPIQQDSRSSSIELLEDL